MSENLFDRLVGFGSGVLGVALFAAAAVHLHVPPSLSAATVAAPAPAVAANAPATAAPVEVRAVKPISKMPSLAVALATAPPKPPVTAVPAIVMSARKLPAPSRSAKHASARIRAMAPVRPSIQRGAVASSRRRAANIAARPLDASASSDHADAKLAAKRATARAPIVKAARSKAVAFSKRETVRLAASKLAKPALPKPKLASWKFGANVVLAKVNVAKASGVGAAHHAAAGRASRSKQQHRLHRVKPPAGGALPEPPVGYDPAPSLVPNAVDTSATAIVETAPDAAASPALPLGRHGR